MKKSLTLVCASVLVALVTSAPVHGIILHSNPFDPSSIVAYSSWFEVPNAGGILQHQSYTDYFWDGNSTIEDFHWWGTPLSTVEGFDIEIWSHNPADGMPGAIVYSEFIAGNAGETFVEGLTYSY